MAGHNDPKTMQMLAGLRALLQEYKSNRNVLRIMATRRTWVAKAVALLEFDDTLHANAMTSADILSRPGFSSGAYAQAEGRMLMFVEQGMHKLELAGGMPATPGSKVVFVSHTAAEAGLAIALKDAIETAFPDKIRVFVSSDERDLRPGDRWLQEIDDALVNSGALLVVCSPFAITRPWIHFESGCAWIRRVPVIPVCHSGLKKSDLAPPLSSFQGLTLEEADFAQRLMKALASHFDGLEVPKLDFAGMDKAFRKAAPGSGVTAPKAPAAKAADAEVEAENLTDDAKKLLFEVSIAKDGRLLRTEAHGGYSLTVEHKEFVPETPEPRIKAKWERVLRELAQAGFLNQTGEELYEITDRLIVICAGRLSAPRQTRRADRGEIGMLMAGVGMKSKGEGHAARA